MRYGSKRIGLVGATLLALGIGAAPPGLAEEERADGVGEVVSVAGTVTAARPGQTPRPLACGDAVHAGERVVTAADSRVGILSGEFLVQLESASTLRVDRTAEGMPELELEAGRVRSVDPRSAGPAGRLVVADTRGRLLGTDTEGYVLAEKAGRYAMLCEWDAPLEVVRPDGRITAGPRECVISNPREPMHKAPAHEKRIALAPPDACPIGPVVGSAPLHFSPTDVAAGPPTLFTPPLPEPPLRAEPSPCDDPGSGCTAVAVEPVIPPGQPPPGSFPIPF